MIRSYFLLLLMILMAGCQTGHYQGPPSDHFDGEHFHYYGDATKSHGHFIYDFVSIALAIIQHPWSRNTPESHASILPYHPDGIKVTFVNHSTVLMQTKKVNFLFDPVWSYRASPFSFIGPARVRQPGVEFNKLPPIDVVLVTHNHYDHMDIPTLIKLNETFHPVFIVPLGNKDFLAHYKIDNVIELDWWQQYKIKNSTITFLPAQHVSSRWLYDYNRTLWGSYGVEVEHEKIYFAGDTAYADHFKMIHSRWGSPDFSFIPIGAYEPRNLLKPYHINPQEAVYAHKDLGSRLSSSIHWGTFQLSSEAVEQPVKDLTQARLQANIPENQFIVMNEGDSIFLGSCSTNPCRVRNAIHE